MLQLTSTIKEDATLEIALRDIEIPKPGADDVLIEVKASPINPSDLGTLVGAGDLSSIRRGITTHQGRCCGSGQHCQDYP